MRTLDELISIDDPALPLITRWVSEREVPCDILQPSAQRGDVLVALQVTTRSILGALAFETGGLMIDNGWLRFLGSGHPRLPRDIVAWNAGRASGFLLVADDAVGGFFAINGGTLGTDIGNVYYWPPDSLDWEPLQMDFPDLVQSCLTSRIAAFYDSLRWPEWKRDVETLPGDRCFSFWPVLWSTEGSIGDSHRSAVPVAEAYLLKSELARQLSDGA